METLYHIRKFNDPKDDYMEGQILEFTKDKYNKFKEDTLEYSGSYLEKKVTIDDKVLNYYKDIESLLRFEDLKNKNADEIKRILDIIERFHYSACLEKRELILEEVRRQDFSYLPSRYNCMWLTDEECISSWINLLDARPGNYSINEMELDGDIFVSTDELLPDTIIKTVDIYEKAKHYWNPTQEELNKSIRREYLFEGRAKVKRKIK